jgi:hypothetical protein
MVLPIGEFRSSGPEISQGFHTPKHAECGQRYDRQEQRDGADQQAHKATDLMT